MKWNAKEGQVVLAGYVGNVEKKTDTLVVVSIAHHPAKDKTEWYNVAFCNPNDGSKGPNLADLALKHIEKGQFVAVVCNERKNGNNTNYYAVSVELAPKKDKQ